MEPLFIPKKEIGQIFSGAEEKKADGVEKINYLKILKENENYFGQNFLIKGDKLKDIKPINEEYFIHQSLLHPFAQKQNIKPELRDKIYLLMLNAYSTAATIQTTQADYFNVQTTPFFTDTINYYRSSEFLKPIEMDYAVFLENSGKGTFKENEILLVQNDNFREVLARTISNPIEIDSEEKFAKFVETLLIDAFNNKIPESKILFDISKLIATSQEQSTEKTMQKLQEIFWKIADEKIVDSIKNSKKDKNQHLATLNVIRFFRENVKPIAFLETEDKQSILLIPPFLTQKHTTETPKYIFFVDFGDPADDEYVEKNSLAFSFVSNNAENQQKFYDEVRLSRQFSGYLPIMDQAKEAWLKIKDFDSIMNHFKLPVTELATGGKNIPTVFKNFSDFLNNKAVKNFRQLTNEDESLHLKILCEGTLNLLEGLEKCCGEKGIDQAFKDMGLQDLLQISYFRLNNALKEAAFRKDDTIEFFNQLQIIHQVIQDCLALLEPYDEHAFENAFKEKSFLRPDLIKLSKVQIMPSGMHAMVTAVSAVEAEKGTNQLSTVVLTDSYYETTGLYQAAKSHSNVTLDGDVFNEEGIKKSLSKMPAKPVDLFLCEFHHNISTNRHVYKPENVEAQILALVDEKLVAEKFTVIIDTTINLEQSTDIMKLVSNPRIQQLIQEGKLNLVLIRSAQKFDMLGMDNYSGGFSTSFNNFETFANFNHRMNAPKDQLKGISYQGLTHIIKWNKLVSDKYRQGVIDNTQKLYKLLPKEIIYSKNSTNPIQISEKLDPETVFLDLKFENKSIAVAFSNRLQRFVKETGLLMTTRASFGFPNSNYVMINEQKNRFSPGLENEEALQKYAQFFHDIQNTVNHQLSIMENTTQTQEECRTLIENAILNM